MHIMNKKMLILFLFFYLILSLQGQNKHSLEQEHIKGFVYEQNE